MKNLADQNQNRNPNAVHAVDAAGKIANFTENNILYYPSKPLVPI